jgi:hypothetical protein
MLFVALDTVKFGIELVKIWDLFKELILSIISEGSILNEELNDFQSVVYQVNVLERHFNPPAKASLSDR